VGRVILRRIAGAIPVVLLVTLITFGLMRLIPGDVSAALAGVSATPAEREQIRHNLGLDQPVQVQLVRWYSDLLRGDLGRSLFLGKPVTQATFERLPVTLSISAYSLILTLVLGLASGILAAMRQNSWVDQAAMIFAMLGISMPNFWIGLMMIVLFSVHLG
jgi:peptide/nickel transport system permease protein